MSRRPVRGAGEVRCAYAADGTAARSDAGRLALISCGPWERPDLARTGEEAHGGETRTQEEWGPYAAPSLVGTVGWVTLHCTARDDTVDGAPGAALPDSCCACIVASRRRPRRGGAMHARLGLRPRPCRALIYSLYTQRLLRYWVRPHTHDAACLRSYLRPSTWEATRAAAWMLSSCSHTMTTVQPPSVSARSVSASRARTLANFRLHHSAFAAGVVPCSGHPCQ
jgi:hypothetical protein